MSSDGDLVARKKNQKSTILPVSLTNSINDVTKHRSTSKLVRLILDNVLIIVLGAILHYLITGNIIPSPIISLFSLLSSPFTALFNTNKVPTSVSEYIVPKFLGSYPEHGITSGKKYITEKSRYIFPSIEEARILKEAGLDKLFKIDSSSDSSSRSYYTYSPDYFDDITPIENLDSDTVNGKEAKPAKMPKTPEEIAIQKFKNNGHRIYKGSENPQVVLVTAVNFDRLEPEYLVKCIQNRVDYAYIHGYGVYSRFAQEFVPEFQKSRNDIDTWARVLVLREAMLAFPHAKWFWYLDENTFIMNDKMSLHKKIISKDALESLVMKNQPIIPPNGAVKTYNNLNLDKLSLIVTQSEKGITADSFIIKNDLTGKAILDLMLDPLVKSYPAFRKEVAGCLAHILQWHPFILSKTALLSPRTIHSISPNDDSESHKPEYLFQNDDLVVSFPKCKSLGTCETQVQPFWIQTQRKGRS